MKKRILSLFCALALCLTLLPTVVFAATDTGKSIQLADSGTAENIGGGQADNLYFGTYQQSSGGNGGYNIDPIKWRVLENADGKLFLLSDQNLDVKPYNSSSTSITWEKSTIRSWLNGYAASENNSGTDYSSNNFIDAAFSGDEQVAIADTYVYNKKNPVYNTSGGNDTTDQIFLLSIEEADNRNYFPNANGNDSRKSTNTAYVASYSGMYGVGEADSWWLRSPGLYAYYAAYVNFGGSVDDTGDYVDSPYIAVRPAFHLDLNSVLFTSAAAGGKAGNGLNAVADYDGNEWKLTLLDNSRNFSIFDAKTNGSGDTIVFSYSDAQTGTNEYISVVIEDNGAITYYGRILQLDGTTNGSNGTTSLTLPDGVTLGDTTKLYVFNEQYNGGENDNSKLTDYGSELIEVNPTVDDTAPTLSNGSATRDSKTSATVKFTSDEAGEYYYAVVESGATEPTDIVSGDSANMASGENTINLTNLTAGAKDIYIVAKDAVENVSQTLKIVIPESIPTYTISASPAALDFSNKTVGYTEAPDGQTVTITNTGNQTVTVTLPTSTNYTITAGTDFVDGTATLAPNGTATFAVQPKTGLAVGSYSEPLTISSKHNTSAEVSLAFTVDPKSLDGAQVQVSGSYIYDGNAKEPSGENVTVTLDGEPLTENTDYTLSYENNTDAGEATVKVSGKGNYSGIVTGTFQIAKATPTVTDVAVSSPATIYASTDISTITLTHGADDTPGTVKLDDGQTLSVGEDSYNWIFIPNDGNNYETTTGSIRLTVYEPPQEVDGVYQIDSVTDLFWFAGLVNGTLENVEQDTAASAVLTADIDLSGETWTPIGNYDQSSRPNNKYAGTFDGAGHTIEGLKIESSADWQGFVGYLGEGGVIENLTLGETCSVTGGVYVGGICGYTNGGTIESCTNAGTVTGQRDVGGICGYTNGGTITGCTNEGTVTGSGRWVGGVCGLSRGTVTGCTNEGTVIGSDNVGGVCGTNTGGTTENCANFGAVNGSGEWVGGVCGGNTGTITGCTNSGAVTGNGENVGGIVGYTEDGAIENCQNSGSVTGGKYTGAICGWNNAGTITGCTNEGAVNGSGDLGGICGHNEGTVKNCTNSGAVNNGDKNTVGGICGYSKTDVTGCTNSGAVTGKTYVGGIVGYTDDGAVETCQNSGSITGNGEDVGGICGFSNQPITNCANTGDITGGSVVGGVCGLMVSSKVTISNCYNTGTVTGSAVGAVYGKNGRGQSGDGQGTITNCYYQSEETTSTQEGATPKTADQFSSGEVCWLLNGSTSEGTLAWYQNLDNDQDKDTYPVLDSSHGIVYRIEADPVFYSNDPNSQPPVIISVDITWGELSFTYSDGTWNPDTHEYDGEGWTVDEEGGNSIKVENTGNTDVNVTYEYKAEETGITGSFTDGENPVSAPVSLPENGSSTVYLILAGKPEQNLDHAKIGSVTVTIGGESE